MRIHLGNPLWLAVAALAMIAAVLASILPDRSSHASGLDKDRAVRPLPSATAGSREIHSSGPSLASLSVALRGKDPDKVVPDLTKLLPSDPARVAALVFEVADAAIRIDALRTVAREWAALDPAAALAWATSIPNADERAEVSEFVCYRVAEDDPSKARGMAEAAGFATDGPLSTDLVQQWAVRDPAGAKDWALGRPKDEARETLLANLAPVLAREDPVDAGRIVSGELSGSHQEEAAMSVLHQWAQKDSDAAAAWVDQFPEGSLRKRAEEELKGILAMKNRNAAAEPAR